MEVGTSLEDLFFGCGIASPCRTTNASAPAGSRAGRNDGQRGGYDFIQG
jgi:hypothetical protein